MLAIEYKRYWRDIAWLASGNVTAMAIGLLSMPMLTRLYAPEVFAIQTLFLQVVGFACIIQTFRLEYFLQLASDDVEAKILFSTIVVLSLFSIILAIPFIWIWREELAKLLGTLSIANWLIVVPVTGSLVSVAIALEHYRQRQMKFRTTGLAEVVSKIGYVGSALSGAYVSSGPAGLILSTGFGALAKITWLGLIRKRRIEGCEKRWWRGISPSALRKILGKYAELSRATVISHLLQNCSGLIPVVFIGHQYGTNSLGQFALVNSTISIPTTLIGGSIGKVYYQRAAAQWASGKGYADIWGLTFRRLFWVGLPVFFLLLGLAARWIYPFLFGVQWNLGGQLATIMAFSAFLSFISSPLDRGSYIVNAWRYILAWNVLRVLAMSAVTIMAWKLNWSMLVFVAAYTVQMSVIYTVDLYANKRFAMKLGPE